MELRETRCLAYDDSAIGECLRVHARRLADGRSIRDGQISIRNQVGAVLVMVSGDVDKGDSVRALYRSKDHTLPHDDAVGDIAAAATVRLYEYLGRVRPGRRTYA